MKNTNILATAVAAIVIAALLAMPAFSAPSTKHAVAGAENQLVSPGEPTVILETTIHTGTPKDLIASFTAESILVTQTDINEKKFDDMDMASIEVWVEVDGKHAFPYNITLAERTQVLKGFVDAIGVEDDYEIDLLLDTTAANGFNFYIENVGQGDHVVQVWAQVTTTDLDEDKSPSGVIGDRTLIVQEVDLK